METSLDFNDESMSLATDNRAQDRKRKRPALTIPKTPMLMKRQPKFQRQNHLTAEERELERIKEAKANLAKKKLMAAKEHRKSLDAQSSTAPGKKPLTRPIGFNFATDNRMKEIDSNKQSTAVDEAVDFVKTLRKQQDFNFNPGRTRPEPFVFRGKEPTRENKPGDKVETLAERCAKFTTKTPVRFRTKPRKETEKPANFMDVMAFQNENSNDGNFHAKPLNHKILEGPVGLKPRKHIPLTVPQSPAFSKLHATKNAELKHDSMVTGIPKICPLPANASPFKPHLERRKVEPIPFSFESRDKEMMQKKEEKIKKVFEAEKEAREFYAQPLPCFEPVLPAKKSKPITVPEPFDLEIEKESVPSMKSGKRNLQRNEGWRRRMPTFGPDGQQCSRWSHLCLKNRAPRATTSPWRRGTCTCLCIQRREWRHGKIWVNICKPNKRRQMSSVLRSNLEELKRKQKR